MHSYYDAGQNLVRINSAKDDVRFWNQTLDSWKQFENDIYQILEISLYLTNDLTHLPLVLHICDSKSGQHWFR